MACLLALVLTLVLPGLHAVPDDGVYRCVSQSTGYFSSDRYEFTKLAVASTPRSDDGDACGLSIVGLPHAMCLSVLNKLCAGEAVSSGDRRDILLSCDSRRMTVQPHPPHNHTCSFQAHNTSAILCSPWMRERRTDSMDPCPRKGDVVPDSWADSVPCARSHACFAKIRSPESHKVRCIRDGRDRGRWCFALCLKRCSFPCLGSCPGASALESPADVYFSTDLHNSRQQDALTCCHQHMCSAWQSSGQQCPAGQAVTAALQWHAQSTPLHSEACCRSTCGSMRQRYQCPLGQTVAHLQLQHEIQVSAPTECCSVTCGSWDSCPNGPVVSWLRERLVLPVEIPNAVCCPQTCAEWEGECPPPKIRQSLETPLPPHVPVEHACCTQPDGQMPLCTDVLTTCPNGWSLHAKRLQPGGEPASWQCCQQTCAELVQQAPDTQCEKVHPGKVSLARFGGAAAPSQQLLSVVCCTRNNMGKTPDTNWELWSVGAFWTVSVPFVVWNALPSQQRRYLLDRLVSQKASLPITLQRPAAPPPSAGRVPGATAGRVRGALPAR